MESEYRIVNPEFDFIFGDKTYRIRKANLDKLIQYQIKLKELKEAGDPSGDHKLLAYSIYLCLRDIDPKITEEYIKENTPATIDILDCFGKLGFIDPSKIEMAKVIQKKMGQIIASHDSSQSSQSEPVGLPDKLEN